MEQNNRYYFDTNFILRFLLRDIEDQYQIVRRRLSSIKKEGGVVVILGEVVAECVYVMEKIYKIPRLDIGRSLQDFLKTNMVFCEEKDVLIKTLGEYMSLNLAYVDVLLIQTVKISGGSLESFDKKLLNKAK